MGAERILDLAILVVLLLFLLKLVPASWALVRITAGVRRRRLQDGSDIAPPPTPAVAAIAARLAGLGFARIGERTLVLPGTGRRFEWDLADRSTTTYAAIVPTAARSGGAAMTLYSAYADGAFVQTSWPGGTAITRQDLLATPVSTTPEDAVAVHGRTIVEFAGVHGAPWRIGPCRTCSSVMPRIGGDTVA